jgi:hypothetical protein
MSDVLTRARSRLTVDLDREPPIFEPLNADQWVIKSLLQKSIRRGEVDIAQRAALTFLAQKGSAIWRRFIIIAFEDIGAGSADVVAMTVAGSTDRAWRRQVCGDAIVAAHLARLLAEAPKSRSAEHLINEPHPWNMTPAPAQGETTESPSPTPKASSTNVNAQETTAPAVTAAHETPATDGSPELTPG